MLGRSELGPLLVGHPSQDQVAHAWIEFQGTGTPAATRSHNVSSITDDGAGLYTLTWTRPFAVTTYALAGVVGSNTADDSGYVAIKNGTSLTRSSAQVTTTINQTTADPQQICLIAYGVW